MSAAYKCDRCGKLQEGRAAQVTLTKLPRIEGLNHMMYTPEDIEFDLCPKCSEEVRRCIKNEGPTYGLFSNV